MPGADPSSYVGEPVRYAREILHMEPTPDQALFLEAVYKPPYRVLVPSGHDTGKTAGAAMLVNHWYDSYPEESVILTTAPTQRDVVDLLWTEIRMQRYRAGLSNDFNPRSPEMGNSPVHYAKGFTARKGESFQGRHRKRMLFIFDEANGIDPIYWITTRTMFDPALGHAWLVIFNPTDTTSHAYLEDSASDEGDSPTWTRIHLSALNHPNIARELAGLPKKVPGAVSLAMIDQWIDDWCEPIDAQDRQQTDLEWRPESGKWYRPGPIFQSRAQGLWPDTGSGVWSDALWAACLKDPRPPFPLNEYPRIGCDTATGKGEDYHSIFGRWGKVVLHSESSNVMTPARIGARLKAVAQALANKANSLRPAQAAPWEATSIPIQIDDDGTGGAIASYLREEGYSVTAIGAGTRPLDDIRYPRKRDELWFQVAAKARAGLVHVGLLDRQTQRRLKQQLMAPVWSLDVQGRRCVEPKEDTKEKLGRSPDLADGFNLAYYDGMLNPYPEPGEADDSRQKLWRGR